MTGASQSPAEKPGRPSALSCGMFAETRHRNTDNPDSSVTAAMSVHAPRGSRHRAAPSARAAVTAAVARMCRWVKVGPAATLMFIGAPGCRCGRASVEQDAQGSGGGHQVGLGDLL